jgi:hypothetical protein
MVKRFWYDRRSTQAALFFASLPLRVRFSLDGRTIHSRTPGKRDRFYGSALFWQSRRIYQTLSHRRNEGLRLRVWSGPQAADRRKQKTICTEDNEGNEGVCLLQIAAGQSGRSIFS